jgi:hypothetical protein
MAQSRNGHLEGDPDVIGQADGPIAPERLGRALIEPTGAFEAGSLASFTLTYAAGHYGIDDSGSLRICWRFAADMTPPQFTDPTAPGFTTVEASNGAVLEARFDPKGNLRPWDKTLYIKVVHGFLAEGDRIVVRLGDPRQGSPGIRLQTFCEDWFEFRVLVDPIASFLYQPLPEQPTIAIVPGPPERLVAVLPTLCRRGDPFTLKVKAEDRWGNPSDRSDVTLRLRASLPVEGLADSVRLERGRRSVEIGGLQVRVSGDLEIELADALGDLHARADPMRVVEEPGCCRSGRICMGRARRRSAPTAPVPTSLSPAISPSSMLRRTRATTSRSPKASGQRSTGSRRSSMRPDASSLCRATNGRATPRWAVIATCSLRARGGPSGAPPTP